MITGNKLRKSRGFETWLQVGWTNLKVHRVLNQSLASVDLTLAQHEILMTVLQQDGITQNALSERLHVVKSNVSALLKKLEARGLVERLSDPDDSRNKMISLTQSGNELVERSFKLQNKIVEAMTAELSDDDLQHLSDVMSRGSRALDTFEQPS
ncbi:MAG: MarR family transcriptional regulator [Congregibacter sp.]|nr:MarR family transcriptional regulator [Congregibacter sp.]